MKKSQTRHVISISQDTYEMLRQTRKGTNLTESDVIDLLILQYLKPGSAEERYDGI